MLAALKKCKNCELYKGQIELQKQELRRVRPQIFLADYIECLNNTIKKLEQKLKKQELNIVRE